MSFRDSFVPEDSGFSGNSRQQQQRDFHPIRDLIDGVRESFRARQERRQQARMDRDMERLGLNDLTVDHKPSNPQRHVQIDRYADRSQRPQENRPQEYYPQVRPQPQQANIERRSTVPVMPIPTDVGTRGKIEFISTPVQDRRVAGGYQSEEPPLADPKEAPADEGFAGDALKGLIENAKDNPQSHDRGVLDTLSIKEKSGEFVEIAPNPNATADVRLNAYLRDRGAQLLELDVNGSGLTDRGLGLLKMAPNLNKLMLNDCEVNDDSMTVLGQQGLKNLKELNLHSTRVGDDGIAKLKDMNISNLNLSDTIVTDDGMQHLKQFRSLQVLNLDYSSVGNEGIKALKEMPNLRSVSLKGTSLSDDAVVELAKAKQLMVLNLEDTKITAAGIQKLQREMPRCIITADPQGPTQADKRHDRRDRHQEQKPTKWFRSPFVVPHRS